MKARVQRYFQELIDISVSTIVIRREKGYIRDVRR